MNVSKEMKPIVETKDKDEFLFEMGLNAVPYPHRPIGRKHLPVVTSRSEMIPWALYWVRVWTGGGFHGSADNWALCEHTTLVEGGIEFKILACTSNPEKIEIVTMLDPALRRKQIRLAQTWSALEHEEVLDKSVQSNGDGTFTIDLSVKEPAR
jgi:hypothetical protein